MHKENYAKALPKTGSGEQAAYDLLSRDLMVRSARLGSNIALVRMDPPTPDIASKLVGLNAQFDQKPFALLISPT